MRSPVHPNGAATAPGGGGVGRAPTGAALRLAVLAAAAFVYVTAETLPVGLLPQLATGLHVSDGSVGLLVTVYAAVAGLTAVPLTAWSAHLPRRQLVVGAVALLALSQAAIAVAPDYGAVLGARVVCAVAHGVFWSVLAPVAAGLVAPERAGRATAVVFTGNSLALVLGTPLATTAGQLFGWRVAAGLVAAAATVTVVALRVVLPPFAGSGEGVPTRERLAAVPSVLRQRALLAVCAVTALVVIGQFTAYTYISDIVGRDAGMAGLALSAVLLAYGAAGIAGTAAVGWIADARPRRATLACTAGVAVALGALTVFGPGDAVATVASVVVWGAAFTAVPVCLQSAILRVAPRQADTASAVYVVAFQIGIGGGALAGSILVDAGRLPLLPVAGAVPALIATVVVVAARAAFPAHRPAGPGPDEPGTLSESSARSRAAAG